MTMISDLPHDLVETILSRAPLTSMRRIRFTCKLWNALTKDTSFANKLVGKASRQLIVMSGFRVWLMSLNFQGDPYMKGLGKLSSLNNSYQVEISKVFHCNGLLLCVTKDKTRLVVWNPCSGQTRWIKPRNVFHKLDRYALGFDKNNNNQKILRFMDHPEAVEYEIYDFKSNSWRDIDVTRDWDIDADQRGVSLKGNTYFVATERRKNQRVLHIDDPKDFLICFDFTRERFGPRLTLPFHSSYEETVTLSSVRDEQLAALYQKATCEMEIWVTNKIEPEMASWSKLFLAMDMMPFNSLSFFIDEERKIAVIFDKDIEEGINDSAYMIGENGYYKEVDLGYLSGENGCYKEVDLGYLSGESGYLEQLDIRTFRLPDVIFPLVCSYFPSSVKIQQGAGAKRKERDYDN